MLLSGVDTTNASQVVIDNDGYHQLGDQYGRDFRGSTGVYGSNNWSSHSIGNSNVLMTKRTDHCNSNGITDSTSPWLLTCANNNSTVEQRGHQKNSSCTLFSLPLPQDNVHLQDQSMYFSCYSPTSMSMMTMKLHLQKLTLSVMEGLDNRGTHWHICRQLEQSALAWLERAWKDDDTSFLVAMGHAFFTLASVYYANQHEFPSHAERALDYTNKALCFLKKSNAAKKNVDASNQWVITLNSSPWNNKTTETPLFDNDWGPYWECICEAYILGGHLLLDQHNWAQSSHYFKTAYNLVETALLTLFSFPPKKNFCVSLCADVNQNNAALFLKIRVLQGLGLAYYNLKRYDVAKTYGDMLVKAIVSLNQSDDITAFQTKMYKELNARTFHLSCLFRLATSNPCLVEFLRNFCLF
ncbi:hypothetical protein RFI_40404, partial [Reticulomyxa filosa]